MPKRRPYRTPRASEDIFIRGEQRKRIDADLMAEIVIQLGRQLAREAKGLPPIDDGTVPGYIPRDRIRKRRK